MDPSGKKGVARGKARGRSNRDIEQSGPSGSHGGHPNPNQGRDRPGGLQERKIEESMASLQIQSSSSGNGNGNGDNGRPAGRGVMRGQREISRILITRPKPEASKAGKSGTDINLIANYFPIQKKSDWILCLYHVDFNPDEDRTGLRKKLLRQHASKLGNGFLFDGMQLYMSKKLGKNETHFESKDEISGQLYQVKLKFIKELGPYDGQYIQILNILLRRCQEHLGLQLMGRNFYNPSAETVEEQFDIKIWPGFSTAIRHFEESILLNVDVTHKFLRNQTVLSAMMNMGPRGNFTSLCGTVVMTTYNKRTYRIDDFDMNSSPKSTFPYRETQKSYIDYYREKYNINIRDPHQPMIVSKPKKAEIRRGMTGNIYLVPELCIMTGLADEMRSNFNVMKSLASYMRMTPDRRVSALQRFNSDLIKNKKVEEELAHWGLKIDPKLVNVRGRILPAPKITMSREITYQNADWTRSVRGLHLSRPVVIDNWAVVYPSDPKWEGGTRVIVDAIMRTGNELGMRIARPEVMPIRNDRTDEYLKQLKCCAGKQLVLVVLPNNRGDRYGAIKKFLSCTLAVPSQCVLGRTVNHKNAATGIAMKITIQINCKLGGEAWQTAIPMKCCMVIGYDTYHDSATRNASYGAVVSSINPSLTRYFGQVAKHTSNEELTNNFSASVKMSLAAFSNENKMLPRVVIVFRDGVGEGQIGHVKEHEVTAIKESFKRVYGDQPMPKFAFVVVSKRINTRLFYAGGRGIDNPPPGTVVDSVITQPERYDFFLVSQSVNQGTVSPTSFNVIDDSSELLPDHMQQLSYRLTHLYYNWQGTVRVPAPCLYAHKLAYITGTSIHDQPHEAMRDKLWYL